MRAWVKEDGNNIFYNPLTEGSTGKILYGDVHTAQQTDAVKQLLHKRKTVLIDVPSRVQPFR